MRILVSKTQYKCIVLVFLFIQLQPFNSKYELKITIGLIVFKIELYIEYIIDLYKIYYRIYVHLQCCIPYGTPFIKKKPHDIIRPYCTFSTSGFNVSNKIRPSYIVLCSLFRSRTASSIAGKLSLRFLRMVDFKFSSTDRSWHCGITDTWRKRNATYYPLLNCFYCELLYFAIKNLNLCWKHFAARNCFFFLEWKLRFFFERMFCST